MHLLEDYSSGVVFVFIGLPGGKNVSIYLYSNHSLTIGKMKNLLLFLLLGVFACKRNKPIQTENIVIQEGVGFSNLKIGAITSDTVIKYMGEDYKKNHYGDYSVEIAYEEYGISFYYLQADTAHKMTFNPNFNGKTSKGFRIREMKVRDIRGLYGKPMWHQMSKTVYAKYDSLGIHFSITPKRPFPTELEKYEYDQNLYMQKYDRYYDSLYTNQAITLIVIGKPGTAF